MKRVLAWVAYSLGAYFALSAVVQALLHGVLGSLPDLALALGWWWIAMGIGIRLGMEPWQFVERLLAALGLARPTEKETDPSRPGGL